jgi:TonB family protein
MTNQALIYRRPSKWPIAAALAAAVVIHLSAVAIAFHRELPGTESTIAGYPDPFVDIESAADLPIPSDSHISLPPPPALVPTADFIEPQETRQPTNRNQNPTPIRRQGLRRLAAVGNGKAFALGAPRPNYPYEARKRHITGSGIAMISVEPTGLATDVTMEQSIGNPILDNSAVSGFHRWRFKSGSPSRFRIPITFLLTRAQY